MLTTSVESAIRRHLQKLCAEIGPRPIGSRGNFEAAAYIREALYAAGFEVSEQRIDCPAWQHLDTALSMKGERLPAVANIFSSACDVTAPLIALGTLHELEAADITGRVVVMCGDLSKEPLIPKYCTLYNSDRDQAIHRLLDEKRPAALLMVNLQPGGTAHLVEDWNMTLPSATVPAEVGRTLLQHLQETVHLKIEAVTAPSSSVNLIAHKPGRRAEHLVLCAHYDTKLNTPGALDNGAGVATLLALAEQLAPADLDLGLEFVAFTGEEYSNGEPDGEYIRLKGDELSRVFAAINFDGVGYAIGANTITMMSHSPAFQAQVEALTARWPSVVWVEPWPQSNHSTFAWRGVPAIAFSSIGAFGLAHLPIDTIEWVSVDKLLEVAALVAEVITAIQDKPIEWSRPN